MKNIGSFKTHFLPLFLLSIFFLLTCWSAEDLTKVPIIWFFISVLIVFMVVFLIFWITHFALERLHNKVPFEKLNVKHWLMHIAVATFFSLFGIALLAVYLTFLLEGTSDYGISLKIQLPTLIVVVLTITFMDFFKRQNILRQNLKTALEKQITELSQPKNSNLQIPLTKGNKNYMIDINDIAYLVSEDKITTFVLFDKTAFVTYDSLRSLHELYFSNPDFFFANRNFIVNRKTIGGWERTSEKHIRLLILDFPNVEVLVNKNNGKRFLEWLNA